MTQENRSSVDLSVCVPQVPTDYLLEIERTFWDMNFIKNIFIPKSGISDSSRVLLAGCGVGAIGRLLYESVPNGFIVGIDSSANSVSKGQELNEQIGINNMEFIVGNVLELDTLLGGEQFDFVLDDGVLSYFPNEETEKRALSRLINATRTGGIVGSFELDYSALLMGNREFDVLEATYKLHMALIRDGYKQSNPLKSRNLMLAPQITKMFWDGGLRDISFTPYTPPEPFPPYSSDVVYTVEVYADKYRKGSESFKYEYQKLQNGGLSSDEIEYYCDILYRFWSQRLIAYRNNEVPPLFTQVFLATFGKKA